MALRYPYLRYTLRVPKLPGKHIVLNDALELVTGHKDGEPVTLDLSNLVSRVQLNAQVGDVRSITVTFLLPEIRTQTEDEVNEHGR